MSAPVRFVCLECDFKMDDSTPNKTARDRGGEGTGKHRRAEEGRAPGSGSGAGGGGGKGAAGQQKASADHAGKEVSSGGKDQNAHRGGGGGGGGGRRRENGGGKRQAEQPPFLNTLELTRRYSGLFFGVYVLAHMIQQAVAAAGPAGYDALRRALRAVTIDNLFLEIVLVWAPLAVHLGSDVAFRFGGGKKGGGLRRRVSFFSGYALLLLVLVHVGFTRVAGADPSQYEFAPLAKQLSEQGVLPVLFLTALAAAASLHLAAGSINAVHQIKSFDRSWRARLDWSISCVAAVLFLGVCLGLTALWAYAE